MKLSLVVPCYNEAENVAAFQDAVIGAFEGCGYDYEIVFVNDGSKDATLHNLKKLHAFFLRIGFCHDSGKSLYRIERSAYFMAHVCKEKRFHTTRIFCFVCNILDSQ